MTGPARLGADTPQRRPGRVLAVQTNRAQITLGGDEDPEHTVLAPYLDSYTPRVNDVVEVLTYGGGSHKILGRMETVSGVRRVVGAEPAAVSGIGLVTAVEVVRTPALLLDGSWLARLELDWSSAAQLTGTIGRRLKWVLEGQLNGAGGWVSIGACVVRFGALTDGHEGGSVRKVHGTVTAPAAGSWVYRATAIGLSPDAATFRVNADGDGPVTLTAERWA